MKRFIFQLLAPFLAAATICAAPADPVGAAPAVRVAKPQPLPLAIDDAIQFRKTSIYLNDQKLQKPTIDEMINYQRQRWNYGAITAHDRLDREGYYYIFYWRTKRPADLILRFEYRQEKLGSYVQARERTYHGAKGSVKSEFSVVGDDYNNDGKVVAWRALLIENGKIVALNQSFLWD